MSVGNASRIFANGSTSNIPNLLAIVILPLQPQSSMNREDSDRIHDLCSLIEKEQDPDKFLILVTELNRILSAESSRLQSERQDDPESD